MEIPGVTSVDWSAPWLAPIRAIGAAISSRADWLVALNRVAEERGVRNHRGQRIVFVEPRAAQDEPYESFIARTGAVPTRPHLHDFFNALMFLHLPKSKAELNRLQSAAIERDGIRAVRGPIRDAATLIDENAVVLVTRLEELVNALRQHDWPEVFLRRRVAWNRDIKPLAFGHALLEKLVRPYKAITAHAIHVSLEADASLTEVDQRLASLLDEGLTPVELMPLPVLGIPDWYAPNAFPGFYQDDRIFRPATMRRPRTPEKRSNETRRT
ncbi:MAG: DUF3025 domain-containing protein [Burkholderiaceae bacterium]